MDGSNERHAGDIISRLVENLGLRDHDGVVPLVASWSNLVGVDLAAHSRVVNVEHGVVLVGVDHPAWLQRIQLKQDTIVRTIQRSYPQLQIRRLAFSIASPDARMRPRTNRPLRPPVQRPQPDDHQPRAEQDEDLQQSLTALRKELEKRDGPGID